MLGMHSSPIERRNRQSPNLAQGCRLWRCSKVGGYLRYTDRRANVARGAFDPHLLPVQAAPN
jgi:hypothetical protein